MKKNKEIRAYINLFKHISLARRRQILISFALMIISGIFEVITLSSVIPLLGILEKSNPNNYLQENFKILNTLDQKQFFIFVSLLFISFIVISALFRMINIRYNYRLSAVIGSDLCTDIYKKSLSQNYEYQISRNTSEVIAGATTQITFTVEAIAAIFQFFLSFVLISSILLLLMYVNFKATVFLIIILGFAYIILGNFSKKRLNANGKIIADSNNKIIKTTQEGLGSIVDIILQSNYNFHIKAHKEIDTLMRLKLAECQFLAGFPKYTIEAVGITLIVFLALYLNLSDNSSVTSTIEFLGVYALAAQRILPAAQQAYESWVKKSSNYMAVVNVIQLLKLEMGNKIKYEPIKKYQFKEKLELRKISFHYEKDGRDLIDDITLEINKGDRLGIIGSTGSGKSTLIKIIMCLLAPHNGELILDGRNLYKENSLDNKEVLSWRKTISHVPQSLFLIDGSFKNNIAFGINEKHIDFERVIEVANIAQISDFIENTKYGYSTIVGENGINLSGGQRQRIGLARALYQNPSILILDEATSALDNDTEKKIINQLNKLSNEITIIMIAHRLNTLKYCNRIINLSSGKINESNKSFIV